MISFFRNFFKSKIGIAVTLAFLGLIALAFASMDVANTTVFGGVAGGDRVAVVGDRRIDAAELSVNATNALNQARQQDPTLTMETFAAGGGVAQTLEQMLSRTALAEFGREYGLRAGKRLVDSEIRQIPAFADATGGFSAEAYQAALRQQGLSDRLVREDLAMGLFARQLITPITLGTRMPRPIALRYAQLLRETRRGAIGLVPSAAFVPEGGPSAQQLETYYRQNRARYVRPERRVIRYAAFGSEALTDLREPTDAEIAARFRRDAAQFAAREQRGFTQVIVPTEGAARQLAQAVAGGTSLEAAARAQGFATTAIGPLDRAALADPSSAAVAGNAFQAAQGALVEPARGELGWYVLRVDAIERRPAQTLAQARSEIAETLATEQRTAALGDITARIEEELEDGRGLAELARELGLDLTRTAPVTADGRVYPSGEPVPPLLTPALETAFDMDEGDAQIAVLEPGRQFLIFGVDDVAASAAAPLAEIRNAVAAAWRRDQGFAAARQASQRIARRVAQGQSLAAAMQAEQVPLPPVEAVDLAREEIAAAGQLPPPLALMFSMAEGTVKRVPDASNEGWYVVALNEIVTPELDPGDPIVSATLAQLSDVLDEEYVDQFIAAVRDEVGIERNPTALEAVTGQLTGATN